MMLRGKYCTLEKHKKTLIKHVQIQNRKIKSKFSEMDNPDNLMLHVELVNKQVKPTQGPVILHLLNLPGMVDWTVGFNYIIQ